MSRKSPITLLLDQETIQKLERLADSSKKSLSQVLRETVERGLKEAV